MSGPPPGTAPGDDPRLGYCLDLVDRVLSGEVTEETDEMLFEEDEVLICVRVVEHDRPGWLHERLADRRLPLAGRLLVVRDCARLYDEGLRLLRAEDPAVAPDLKFRGDG